MLMLWLVLIKAVVLTAFQIYYKVPKLKYFHSVILSLLVPFEVLFFSAISHGWHPGANAIFFMIVTPIFFIAEGYVIYLINLRKFTRNQATFQSFIANLAIFLSYNTAVWYSANRWNF